MNPEATLQLDIRGILTRYLSKEALDRYYVELMRENQHVNLVSRETSREDFDRLCAESLLPLEILPEKMNGYLDIGAGGGIPAIPLLFSGRISGPVTLVERTQKKAAALGRIVRACGLDAQIMSRTFEELVLNEQFDLITLRYVKLTPAILKQIIPRLTATGRFIYYARPEFEIRVLMQTPFAFRDSENSIFKSFTVFSTK